MDTAQLRDLQAQVENAPPAEALAAARKLIELLNPLAEQAPAKYLGQLATAWYDYGTALIDVEGPGSAVDPLTTAVGMARDTANDSDGMSLLRLIQSLQSLAGEHLAAEDVAAAYPLLQEALQVSQRLAMLDLSSARLLDPKTLQLLAACHFQRHDHPQAIEYGRQAEELFRQAVKQVPELLPDLAITLKNLALSLNHEHAPDAQRKEAQRKIDEAFMYFRRLAKRAPGTFTGEYASTAFHAAAILMARGKRLQATGAYESAADLYAEAVRIDPGLAESYRIAATTAAEVYELTGNQRRARKLRERHGI